MAAAAPSPTGEAGGAAGGGQSPPKKQKTLAWADELGRPLASEASGAAAPASLAGGGDASAAGCGPASAAGGGPAGEKVIGAAVAALAAPAAPSAAVPAGPSAAAPAAVSAPVDLRACRPIRTVPDKWRILPAFLRAKGLVKQHVDSFNFFVKTEMRQIIHAHSNRRITVETDKHFYIEFLDIRVGAPKHEEGLQHGQQPLTPMMCRHRDITYAGPILVDVELWRGTAVHRRRNVEIGRLPIMLRSAICVLHGKSPDEMQALGECPQDPGGYFVVKGTEKVILMQEQISKNRIIVEYDYKGCLSAVVSSATAETKSRTMVVLKGQKMYVRHNSFTEDLPLAIVLVAMGMTSHQEIAHMIGHVEKTLLSLQDAFAQDALSEKRALLWLGRRVKQRAWKVDGKTPRTEKSMMDEAVELLHRILLAHVPSAGVDFSSKTRLLCLMARRLLDAAGDSTLIDDKDYYGNKRLELAGQMISLMFEDLFKRFAAQVQKQAEQLLARYHQAQSTSVISKKSGLEYPDCFTNIPTDIITRGMQSALSTGNWSIKRFRIERVGVSQVLSRFSYIAALGMMTRLNSNVDKGRKCAGPRALQPSQWGMLCPCDTPEGESCGLVKNLSLMTHVSVDDDPAPLESLCFSLGVEPAGCVTAEELHDPGTILVFLNGALLGAHRRPRQFLKNFRLLRRAGKVGEFVSVFVNELHRAIYVASDGGRLCRPLIIVTDGQPRFEPQHMKAILSQEMSFMDLVRSGIIEWIDVNEENNSLIAMRDENVNEDTTHLEIDPLTTMGVVSGLIPYPNHNQSPRNTYQCAMGKQAMGAIAFNEFIRTDTVLYLLVYPQRPLCKTRTIELTGYENLPAGQNASVAVMSYSGYDIEDAIVMNRFSIDRGFGRCYVIKRYSTELKKNYFNGAADRIFPPASQPAAAAGGRASGGSVRNVVSRRFACLDEDGIGRVGELVGEDQIYINKYVPVNTKDPVIDPRKLDISAYRPFPTKYKTPVPAYIDRILVTENNENGRLFKTVLRQTRRPEYGDKFSSRHGQKGVVGLIVPQENMPFNEAGWCPDLIMNPHGFPSRMTVGKMIELIAGKSALLDGKFKYGTAFGGTKVDEIGRVLMGKGFHYSGKEFLTSGITGEPLQTYVFVGPIFYQKLKHMVQDKIHARGRGPRQLLTRQPTEGRSKQGGLRLGEMERDCLVAYGTANLLLERLLYSSDAFNCSVCRECGLMGYACWCPYCESGDNIQIITLPYACKLLFQEMTAMNVCPKLRLKDK